MFSSERSETRPFVAAIVLILAIAAAYALSLRGDFLWDDDLHVTANPTIVGPLGLKEIWTTARANYFPLVLTNFWVQHALWELNPVGYHVVTIACHAIAALLLWRVLLALRVPGAWLGAALWALHPVQVESVAWICELKNTQSAIFFLAAIWFWIRWLAWERESLARSVSMRPSVPRSQSNAYVLALCCGVCALLSKPSTVMLPVALVLCAWWMRGRVERRVAVALIPFFVLSGLVAGWTIWEQKFHSGAIGPEWSQTFPERIAIAGKAIWFYLAKLAWPEPLIFIYPRWQIEATQPIVYLGAEAALVGLVLLWRGREGRTRAVLFAAMYFGALLFPVLGFFSVFFFRYSFVGDHFQYLASIGPLALLGAVLARLSPRMLPVVGGLLVIALGIATSRQCLVYRNNEALWRDTLEHNPKAIMAWLNLGDTLLRAERHDEAIATFRHALKLRPDDPYAWNDLGCELLLIGQPNEAIAHLEHALTLKTKYPEAHNNLGNALRKVGRTEEAMMHYRRAIELDPKYAEPLNNLGAELAEQGKVEEALDKFKAALELEPRDAAAYDNLGSALRKLGRVEEGVAAHRRALQFNPKLAAAHANLGQAAAAAGRAEEALPYFLRALELRPGLTTARGQYAAALVAVGRPAEAMRELERAVQLDPQSAEAEQNLGVALAQSGRLPGAIEHFETALKLRPEFTMARLNFAQALGATNRWSEALAQLRSILEREPDHLIARAQLAVGLVNTGELAAAVPEFEQALSRAPDSAELHNNFAQLLGALGRKREAFEHFEKAAELQRTKR